MPFTQQQAQNYLNTLPPARQAEIQASLQASGNTLVQWFTNAVNAGVPNAVQAAGGIGVADQGEGWEGQYITEGGEPTSAWLGKRKPVPVELRRLAAEQSWSEDFKRFKDAVVAKWINEKWDVTRGGFFTTQGVRVEKPIDSVGGYDAYGPSFGGAAPGAGGGRAGARVGQGIAGGLLHSPAQPSPAGARLQDLQRVLEDQLLGRRGIFGLADARTGSSGVRTTDLYGQPLSGGGLWWGGERGMFDPNKQPQPQRRRRRAAAPALPAPAPTPEAAPAPAPVPASTRVRDAIYQKFPARGPFSRWMTQ